MDFKSFIIESEKNMKDVRSTLLSIPKKYAALIQGYKFVFQPDNGLKNDPKHVGVINSDQKTVTIAAPWNYSREWVVLHEVAHLIWGKSISKEVQKKWIKICKSTSLKNNEKDIPEELFCHAFASTYVSNKMEKYNYPHWKNFIKNL